jgi:hypothetical protein
MKESSRSALLSSQEAETIIGNGVSARSRSKVPRDQVSNPFETKLPKRMIVCEIEIHGDASWDRTTHVAVRLEDSAAEGSSSWTQTDWRSLNEVVGIDYGQLHSVSNCDHLNQSDRDLKRDCDTFMCLNSK